MLGIDGLKRATAGTSPYATGNLGAPVLAAMPGRTCQESVGVVGIINESAFGCAGGGIRFDDAVEHVLSLAPSRFRAETVPLVDCAGRVIAAPFEARLDLPDFDRSAMDGYAVSCADLKTGAWLPTIGRTAAGEAPGRLCSNSAHRIMTGAPVPDGADAVIAQENAYQRGSMLQIGAVPPVGSNVRRRGEDIRIGQWLIAEGATLDWRHIAVLAAQGVQYASVLRRPRVTLLSSGRELRGPGESLAPGQIHDSNLPMLAALLHAGGAVVRTMAVVEDDVAAMRSSLRHAAIDADLVLTTAGISVGEEDYVRDALRDLGAELAVHKVAMKPGKPLAFGRFEDAVFIGLPGNPLAALAGAIGFVRPLLARMGGAGAPASIHARAGFEMSRKSGRTEFVPVCLRQRNACIWAERGGLDGSARLAVLLQASGFAVLSEEDTDVRHGDLLCVFPFLLSDIKPGGEIPEMHRRFMMEPARIVHRQIWRESGFSSGSRSIPEETAVALTYNGGTYAVMMTTPEDLEDFAVGFSLSEGVISSSSDIDSLDIVRLDDGVELRMWLSKPKADRLQERRRHIAGATGCGLCGIDSIAEAMRPAAVIGHGQQFSSERIMAAMQNLPLLQKLNTETRAVHAAAFWDLTSGIVALREDVGRHNALDKLSGALARASVVANNGIILLTSRVSVEMVQKSAVIGAPVMVSVSAPTALAVRMADAAGITLAAIARADGFEVFTHPCRISSEAVVNVAYR